MTYKTTYLFLLLIFSGLLSSCGSKQAKVLVDNPTKKAIRIGFDNGFKKTIGPYKTELITFDNMNATMTVDGKDLGEIVLTPGKEYILNPTLNTYVIEKIMYGDGAMSAMIAEMMAEKEGKTSDDPLPLASIEIDTHTYFGYAQTTDELLIEKFWDLDMTNAVPKQIEVSQYNQTASKVKIFREYEFIRFHKLGQKQ